MSSITQICDKENERMNILLEYLKKTKFDYEIEKSAIDFVNRKRCICKNIYSLAHNILGIKYKTINDDCSILILYSYGDIENVYNISIVSESLSINKLSELEIGQDYNEYYCNPKPIININRVRNFLQEKILNETTILGNDISYVNYTLCENDETIYKSVGYYPYDVSLERNRLVSCIDLTRYDIRIFSNDCVELDQEYITKWLELFYDGEPRSITQMVGYFSFSETLKEKEHWKVKRYYKGE